MPKQCCLLVALLVITAGNAYGQSTLWFYRPADSPNPNNIPTVYEAGAIVRPLAPLKPGEFFGLPVRAGAYRYSYTRAPARGEYVEVQARAGEDVFIEVHYREFRKVDPGKGVAAIASGRPVSADMVVEKSLVFGTPQVIALAPQLSPKPAIIQPTLTAGPVAESTFSRNAAQLIRIYVTASKSADGFVDSSRAADSAADIRNILSNKKHTETIRLVDSEQAADLVLEVKFSGQVPVGTEIDTRIRAGTFGGINSTTTTETKTLPGIGTVLRVRGTDYSKELSHVQQLFWRDLAGRIVDQLDSWIETNSAQLRK